MLLDTASSNGGGAGGFLVLALIGLFYFLPSIVAYQRHNLNSGGVLVVNLLLGWTFLGWIIAFAMAAGGMRREHLGMSAPPQYSPDGKFWWNGREWVPVPPQSLPPGPQ